MTITLSGEPKSTQHIYRSACRGGHPVNYMTAEGKLIKRTYQLEARAQWGYENPSKGSLAVSVIFYFATKHKRDLDNQNKLVLDALSGICYEDDAQIDQLTLRRSFDQTWPRIEVTIDDFKKVV